jgi:hypothetical protein
VPGPLPETEEGRLERFREEIAKWNRGERVVPTDLLSPDFELHSRMVGMQRGPEAIVTWQREIDEQFERWEIRVREGHNTPSGGFLVLGDFTFRGRGSGVETESPTAWLLELSGGLIRRMQVFLDHDEARSAAGLK